MPINKPIATFAENGSIKDYHGLIVTYPDGETRLVRNIQVGQFQLKDNWYQFAIDTIDAGIDLALDNVDMSATVYTAFEQVAHFAVFDKELRRLTSEYFKAIQHAN